ncbi:hypothetical protein Tco_0310540, partial [Tanacetum coccineum]
DAPLLGVNTPGSVEGSLSQTELTDLVLKLSKKVEGLETEDPSIQFVRGRMIEDIELDVETSLVQPHATKDFHFFTPTKISASGEAHSSDISPEDQLGVLSAAKILAVAVKQLIVTSDFFSAAKASVNNAGDSIPVKDKDPGQR